MEENEIEEMFNYNLGLWEGYLVLTCTVIYVVHAITNPSHKFSSQTLINIAMRDHVIASRIATLEWQHLSSQLQFKKLIHTYILAQTCIKAHR